VSPEARDRLDIVPYRGRMNPSAPRVLAFGRRVLTCTAVGFALGAIPGVCFVLIGWFPGAMVTFAEHPDFVDPRSIVWAWVAAWTVPLGALGAAIGFGIAAIPHGRVSAKTPDETSAARSLSADSSDAMRHPR